LLRLREQDATKKRGWGDLYGRDQLERFRERQPRELLLLPVKERKKKEGGNRGDESQRFRERQPRELLLLPAKMMRTLFKKRALT
jgi:hypothetical protein